MKDEAKTKKQLIQELADLRQRIAELEAERVERQRAEEGLRQLARRHEAILNEIPDIIMEVDTNKAYSWANPAGYEFFGSDVMGKEASFYFEGEQETYAQVQPLFNGDPNLFYVESWQRRRDGQRRLLAWWCHALKDAQGRVTGALSTARDITDLHRAKQTIRDSEERYRAIVEQSPDGIFLEDVQTRTIMEANPAFQAMLGYSPEEIRGLAIYDIVAAEQGDIDERFQGILASQVPFIHERQYRRKDGSLVEVWLTSKLISYRGREVLCTLVRDLTERKRAEEALKETERAKSELLEKLNEAQYLAKIGSWEWDLQTNHVWWSDETYRIFGVTQQDFVPSFEANSKFYHPDDLARFIKSVEHSLKTGKLLDVDLRLVANDGLLKHCHSMGKGIYDDSGQPIRFIGMITDITERKLAEEALRQSEERYRAVMEQSFEAIHLVDAETKRVIEANRAFTEMLGYRAQEIVGLSIYDIVAADPEDVSRKFEEILQGKGPLFYERQWRRKDGSLLYVWITVSPISYGGKKVICAIAHDITDRKRAEEALQQRAGEIATLNSLGRQVSTSLSLNDVVKAALDGVVDAAHPDLALLFLAEADRLVLRGVGPEKSRFAHAETPVHRVGECLCGLAASEGKPIYSKDIHHDPRCTWEECKKAGLRSFAALPLHGGEEVIGVLALAAGTERDFATQAPFLEIMAHQIAIGLQNALLFEQVQHHAADLDRRVRERTAQLEAANAELEAFSYSVSHDLRAPLRHIHGFAELLAKRAAPALDEKARRHLTLISDSAAQMSHLIEDLLAFSRMGRAEIQKTPVDLGQLVSKIREEAESEAKGRKIHWTIGPLPAVWGDPVMLRLVFSNLLSNAIKFTRPRETTQIEIGSLPGEGSEVIVYIRDNGVGFDMKYADKLFGVFQRLHSSEQFEGTGIGLASVRRIIHRHGGRTWAEGNLDAGATFYVSFPQIKEGTP